MGRDLRNDAMRRVPRGWSKAKSALDTASGVSGWWLHDLRHTLATGLQRLGVRLEVTEAVLNHLIPSPIDQNWCAHWRNPMDMMRQG